MISHIIRQRAQMLGRTIQADPEVIDGSAAALVERILGGHFHLIDRITEVVEDEGTARDVTADIAIATARHCGRHDIREVLPRVYDFIETHAGAEYAHGLRIIDRSFAA